MSKHDYLIFVCILLWGLSNFINRISVEKINPLLMPSIVGAVYIVYACGTRFFLPDKVEWSTQSVILTASATVLSITASILSFSVLKGSDHSGSIMVLTTLHPVITLLLCSIFLHEKLSTITCIGVFLLITGSILISFQNSFKL